MSGFDDNKHKCNIYLSVLIEYVPNIEYSEIAWLIMLKEQVLRIGTQDQLAGKTLQNFRKTLRKLFGVFGTAS